MDRRLIRTGLLFLVGFGLLACGPMAMSAGKVPSLAALAVHAQDAPRRKVARPTPTPIPQPTVEQTNESTDSTALLPVVEVRIGEVRIGESALSTMIGDRLSPVLYGQTVDGDLFQSVDGGASWDLVVRGSDPDDFVMSPADPTVFYRGAGLACGAADAVTQPFFRSDDGGVTWTRIPIGDNLVPLLAHPQDADVLLAADCDMPYLTEDGGESWLARPDLSSSALWKRYEVQQIAASSQVGDLPADKANWHYLYAAGTEADGASMVAYSGDIGDHWERITPRVNPESVGLTAIAADPYTAGRLWFADERGIWYSEDFGVSWLLMQVGLEAVGEPKDASGVTALAVGPDGALFVGTPNGLYRGDGVGGEWMPVGEDVLGDLAVEDLLFPGGSSVLWIDTADAVYRYSGE